MESRTLARRYTSAVVKLTFLSGHGRYITGSGKTGTSGCGFADLLLVAVKLVVTAVIDLAVRVVADAVADAVTAHSQSLGERVSR